MLWFSLLATAFPHPPLSTLLHTQQQPKQVFLSQATHKTKMNFIKKVRDIPALFKCLQGRRMVLPICLQHAPGGLCVCCVPTQVTGRTSPLEFSHSPGAVVYCTTPAEGHSLGVHPRCRPGAPAAVSLSFRVEVYFSSGCSSLSVALHASLELQVGPNTNTPRTTAELFILTQRRLYNSSSYTLLCSEKRASTTAVFRARGRTKRNQTPKKKGEISIFLMRLLARRIIFNLESSQPFSVAVHRATPVAIAK